MASRPTPDFEALIAAVARELAARDIPFMLIDGQAVLLHWAEEFGFRIASDSWARLSIVSI
jgi:predicted nucleic acid-binding Zn ribbon protein